jgi:hypothetical protein
MNAMKATIQTSASGSAPFSVVIPEPTPDGVSAWLAELPLVNARYCLEAMEAALESFNARPGLHASTRLVLAELARPTVLMLTQRAESLLLDASVPYPADIQVNADYGIRLHRELGMGYAQAAFDPACAASGNKGTLRLLGALYRALEHWGLAMLWTALAYRPSEEEYWLILYRLFRFADARGLLNVRFADAEAAEPCKTPLALFKRAVLFSQANARRLRQRDMMAAFKLLGAMEDLARLGQEPVRDGLTAEFLMDIAGRSPPARTRVRCGTEAEDPRFLHTRNLALLLMDMVEASGTPMQYAIDKSALARVARSLGGLEKRKSMRRPETDSCWCVAGLSPLISALSDPLPFMVQSSGCVDGKPHPMGLEVVRDEEDWTPSGRFEARILRNESPLSKLMNKKRGIVNSDDIWSGGEEAPSQALPAVVEGTIVNSSARGCCIIWPSLSSARTKVGELLGVWLGPDKPVNFVGAIRWLECEQGGLTLGVELLAPAAEVVEVYDSASKPKGRALLLAAVAALRPDPELLALSGTVQVGSVVRLGSGEGVTGYWVREALEATPSFGRYVLMPVQPGLDLD